MLIVRRSTVDFMLVFVISNNKYSWARSNTFRSINFHHMEMNTLKPTSIWLKNAEILRILTCTAFHLIHKIRNKYMSWAEWSTSHQIIQNNFRYYRNLRVPLWVKEIFNISVHTYIWNATLQLHIFIQFYCQMCFVSYFVYTHRVDCLGALFMHHHETTDTH